MTDDDYDALSQKQLASIKRDMRISLEDAAVRATYKVMAELAQPEQEPVAYLCENAVGHKYFRWKKPSSTYKPIALYTTPPQRQWVGLTNEEKSYLWEVSRAALPRYATYAILIEAKLKQKNGYTEENT